MGKVIKAIFDQLGGNETTTESRYQYDYGMVLKFGGAATLPQAYEVHFALDKTGDAVTQIGGADGVTVPDSMFTSGSPIYAWVYLHDGETDGYTQYTAIIPVIKRAAPSDLEPTPVQQSAIDQAIAALGVAVDQTAADVETTTANAVSASASAEAAAESAAEAAQTAVGVEANVAAAQAAESAAEAARDRAVQAETSASQSKTAAAASETNAAASEDAAQASATAAASSAAAALTSEENANGAMLNAYMDANRADAAETAATSAKNAAVTAKDLAQSAQTAAETARTAAQTAKTAAETAATTATTKAGEASTSATNAAASAQSVASSAAQIAQNTEDIEGLKEDLSTLNAEGTVPTSEQMISDNYTEDSVPYHFRKTASDNADREELEIVGGSVAWNQLLNLSIATGTTKGLTFGGASNGEVTISGTSTDADFKNFFAENNSGRGDHKILVVASPEFSEGVSFGTAYSAARRRGYLYIGSSSISSGTLYGRFAFQSGITVDYSGHLNLYDLTEMLGTTIADYIYSLEYATAGAGVALFKSLFPKDYYAYDAGSMQSVSGLSEHVTVGFNAWDEEWELGTINSTTGENEANTSYIRGKNYIPILPNTDYYSKTSYPLRFVFYDENKGFVGIANGNNTVFTTPNNAKYLRFYINSNSYGTTYNHDICINLSDPAKNGTYEPYQKHSYALDDSLTLRGIPTLVDGKIKWDGDVYAPSGKVTRRYGIVDLGTLTWSKDSDYGNYYYANGVPKAAGLTNMICASYVCTEEYGATAPNKTVRGALSGDTTRLFIRDEAYTDAATFKTAMSGVYLVYEVATPTTENADPYVSPQICHYGGTEEFVSTGIVPVGHVTKYPDNLRMKLDNLPWNFASLIAPTESGFKATRNYTTGQLLIVNNVLYKATANIANGGTITPNTNVTATTLAEVIAALS